MLDPRDLALEFYAAVLEGSSLQPQLVAVARALRAEMGFITRIGVVDGAPAGAGEFTPHGIDQDTLADYAAHWLAQDPRAVIAARRPPGVLQFDRLCPPRDFVRSAYWNEFGARRAPGFHTLSASIAEADDVLGVLTLNRPLGGEPFGAEEEAFMTALYPHLRQALVAESRLCLLRARAAALDAGLDALPQGIAVVDAGGRLLHANASLLAMAARRDGLALDRSGLALADARAQAALRHALNLAFAVRAGRIRLLPDGMSLTAPRPSGGLAWAVQVLPLRPGGAGPLGAFAGAVVLVKDPAARRAPSVLLLQRLLGLSPAEAALAAGLAAGQDLAAQARRRGVSRETLRTHLAAIRHKTGCRRQSELVALVLHLTS